MNSPLYLASTPLVEILNVYKGTLITSVFCRAVLINSHSNAAIATPVVQ